MADRYCSNCGNMLEPDARFCSNCGKPVRRTARAPTPETDVPTSRIPTSAQPAPRQAPQYQLHERRGGNRWPMLALAGVLLILAVVEIAQEGIRGAIPAMIAVAAVVLVGSGISYLALARRNGGATFREAVFNWSVVVLVAFAALLFVLT